MGHAHARIVLHMNGPASEEEDQFQLPPCPNCNGSGDDPRRQRMNIDRHQPCPVCNGTGEKTDPADLGLRHQRQHRP